MRWPLLAKSQMIYEVLFGISDMSGVTFYFSTIHLDPYCLFLLHVCTSVRDFLEHFSGHCESDHHIY